VHGVSLAYFAGRYRLYGGVNNLGDQLPFAMEESFPAGATGRSFFIGLRARY
jgi:hypothetical protein